MIITEEIMSIVDTLPIDIKAQIVERILNSINPSSAEIDRLWAEEVERRVEEVRNGKVKPIPGDKVFTEIYEDLSK